MKKRLREIPHELSMLFRDILTRDNDNMEDLLLSIQWILYSRRPLKRAEYYFAVASGLERENLAWSQTHVTSEESEAMDRFVLSSSKGLAELTKAVDPTVQFIHESIRDFLVKDNGIRQLWSELGDNFENSSHERLKKCCHTYITMGQRLRLHSLLRGGFATAYVSEIPLFRVRNRQRVLPRRCRCPWHAAGQLLERIRSQGMDASQ